MIPRIILNNNNKKKYVHAIIMRTKKSHSTMLNDAQYHNMVRHDNNTIMICVVFTQIIVL